MLGRRCSRVVTRRTVAIAIAAATTAAAGAAPTAVATSVTDTRTASTSTIAAADAAINATICTSVVYFFFFVLLLVAFAIVAPCLFSPASNTPFPARTASIHCGLIGVQALLQRQHDRRHERQKG